MVEQILDRIMQLDISQEARNSLYTWEKFQSTQKGPTAPYGPDSLDKIISELQPQNFEISDSDWMIAEQVFASLVQYLQKFVSIDVLALKPAEAWATLPNTTVRGYPFNAKGSAVDDRIIELGGQSPQSALEFMKSDSTLMCSPGFRIQGSPGSEPAKTRLVFIPSVSSQYFDVALVKESMRQLKSCPIFVTWLPKDERVTTLRLQDQSARRRGFTRIQLDWSKFDKHIHPKLQKLIQNYYREVAINGFDIIEQRNIAFLELLDNQIIPMADSKGNVKFYNLPYQLISGRIGTQHDGSLIGLIQQGVIFKKVFGDDIPWDLTNQAGDDALFPVPTHALADLGYEKVLEKVAEATGAYGFMLNPKKAYPNSDGAFLQKLYRSDLGIVGVGSFTRSLASFIWKEDFSKPVKGVKRLWPLELISQISILSEAFSKSFVNIHEVAEIICKWWLDHDDYLVSVISHLGERASANSLFKLLVYLTGSTKDDILDFLGVKSYDHTGVSEALDSDNYGEVFPILNYILANFEPGRNVQKLEELVDIETVHQADDFITGNIG